jgi:hypothetical protein
VSTMLRMRVLLAVAIAIVTTAATPGAFAQTVAEAKTTEVSLFKNGLGFVVREFTVPAAGEYVLRDLPAPAHGSFWILSDQGNAAVKEAVAYSSPRTEMTEATTLLELVRANVGKKVEVRTEADGWTAGTVLAAPERTPKLPVRASGGNEYGYSYYGGGRAYRPPTAAGQARQADYVLLKTDKGVLALPPGEIKGVRAPGTELAVNMPQTQPGAALRMKVTGGGGRFRVAYLEWGLTWAPSYRVDISTPGQAALACKGEIVNDVEDLRGTTVNFITGFPNLGFSEVVSPLAMVGDVSDFIQSLISVGNRRGVPSRREAVVTQQVTMNAAYSGGPGGPMAMMPTEGEVREDLFLYPHPDVTLQPGERGYYQLFTKLVPYEDLYAWEIRDSLDDSQRWRFYWGDDGRQPQVEQEEVWHSLRLTNTGDIPWTTAPAMTTQQDRVLGQDTLLYTAPGAKTLLKITRSLEIGVEQNEKEVSRQRNASVPYYGNWDLVTIQGELRIRNQKNKPITMLIKKTLSGDVAEASPKPGDEATTEGFWSVNPKHLLTWEVKLAPAGRAALTYRYKAYVHR